MKILLSAGLALAALGAATLADVSAAQAQCARNCRHAYPSLRNQFGYGGLVQTWGLGGVANAPWTGGSITGVMPYAPYPYDHIKSNGL